MALEIPLLNTPRQSFDVRLEGQEVHLNIWWQPSDDLGT